MPLHTQDTIFFDTFDFVWKEYKGRGEKSRIDEREGDSGDG
jgi:hypothetical protein